jgi:hypothetical protein
MWARLRRTHLVPVYGHVYGQFAEAGAMKAHQTLWRAADLHMSGVQGV